MGLLRRYLSGLLASVVSTSSHKKCLSVNNPKCLTESNTISLHPNEYTKRLHYYPFAINFFGILIHAFLKMVNI